MATMLATCNAMKPITGIHWHRLKMKIATTVSIANILKQAVPVPKSFGTGTAIFILVEGKTLFL